MNRLVFGLVQNEFWSINMGKVHSHGHTAHAIRLLGYARRPNNTAEKTAAKRGKDG